MLRQRTIGLSLLALALGWTGGASGAPGPLEPAPAKPKAAPPPTAAPTSEPKVSASPAAPPLPLRQVSTDQKS
ncbi:hypothetical protein [Polyangium sp. 15x6]|uniref:hypothetical protein n=1 Tax=Polyangium sp. 15x6 TaxID=3042687 RepID=UPI00249C0F1A|nr:hypothetical protein [Polyangium sp. 15x6]MDI3289029.1 hypothetical protein [Polyangium sp. 15x6]